MGGEQEVSSLDVVPLVSLAGLGSGCAYPESPHCHVMSMHVLQLPSLTVLAASLSAQMPFLHSVTVRRGQD